MATIKLFNPKEDPTNYTIVGDKKMGKTTLMKQLISILKKYDIACMAYDREMQFQEDLPSFEKCTDIPNGVHRQFCITNDTIENFVAVADLYRMQEIKEGRRLVLVIDELDTFYNQWGPKSDDPATKEKLTDWIDYSRHRKVEIWGNVRRPQKVWQHYFEQSNRIFCFHLSGDLARKKLLATIGSKAMMEAVRRLPKYEFLIYPDELTRFDGPEIGNKTDDIEEEDEQETPKNKTSE